MTATAVPTESFALDISGTKPTPFSRLVRVEIRKMADTRAGLWLLISIGLLTAFVMVVQIWVSAANDLRVDFHDFMAGVNITIGILLPVLGILGVTQEWSQRTALVTFTLVPSRIRLFAAKFTALIFWALTAVAVGLVLATLANLAFGAVSGESARWGVGAGDVGLFFLLQVFGLATGFAFGTLFLSSAVAIVLYFVYSFVLPTLFGAGAALIDWFAKLQPWIDFNAAQGPLLEGSVSGEEWAHLGVSGLLWLVLPLVLGLWRVLRAEVK